MSKVLLSSIAIAALACAAPALAAAPGATTNGSSNNGALPDTSRGKPKADQRYCVVYNITGSILPRKTCKTRHDWLAEGLDPLAKQ
jgi:hypothetical protein